MSVFGLVINVELSEVIYYGIRIRYLLLMRSRYLLSSSHNSLNRELLSRLGLATSPCWTEERLHTVQFYLTESLFSYW